MRVAVISDLHIGAKARRYDLRPDAEPEAGVPAYLDEFESFVKSQRLSAECLLISGDIANFAAPEEYELAAQAIRRTASILGVPAKNLAFIPGNHDVSWGIQKLGGEYWRNKKFMPIMDILVPSLGLDVDLYASLFNAPFAARQVLGDLQIIQVNSAYRDDFDTKPHHGALAQETEAFLRASEGEIKSHRPKFTILIVHHHILPMLDPDPYWKDFSVMNNSDLLIQLIQQLGVDFVLHGHKHWPRIWRHRDHPNPLFVVFCAGSFSAMIHESISSKVFNKFHVLEFAERDHSGNLAGNVYSWSYHGGHGWCPSEKKNGISHREPFGYYRDDLEVIDGVRRAFDSVATGGAGVIEVETVYKAIPNVEFLAEHRLRDAIRQVAAEKGARVLQDPLLGKDFIVHG